MLTSGLRGIDGFIVHSGGTIARDGDEMPPQAQRLGASLGLDPTRHRARYLTESMVSESDLIFGMARSHRSKVVTYSPSKISRTFTIREFARLAAVLSDEDIQKGAVGETLRARVDSVTRLIFAQKANVGMVDDPTLDDVVDPYRRDDSTYEQSVTELIPAVNQAVRVLSIAAEPSRSRED
jgi:protein-tyrosine phosphatase